MNDMQILLCIDAIKGVLMRKYTRYWWAYDADKMASWLSVNIDKGLTTSDVQKMRSLYGNNTIYKPQVTTTFDIIKESITQPMILILLAIAGISCIFGEYVQAFVMVTIIFIYIGVEFINVYRSSRLMKKLSDITRPECSVLRGGHEKRVYCDNVVRGDIVILFPGSIIPADGLLISSAGLKVNESSLTGESLSVEKSAEYQSSKDTPLFERKNAVFAGTHVVDGQGYALVSAVGSDTEFGRIVGSVYDVEKERTVLQQIMITLAQILSIIAIVASALIPFIGYVQGLDYQTMVLTWLSMTFLFVPGQPPIIITMALALAALELARKHILIKRLKGAEVIGFTTSIVTDKTGTITENKMTVETLINTQGDDASCDQDADICHHIMYALPDYASDSTDHAVDEYVKRANTRSKDKTLMSLRTFSKNRPYRIMSYAHENDYRHYIAGSPEYIITQSACDDNEKENLLRLLNSYADKGKRVVAYGYIDNSIPEQHDIQDNTFIALVVLHDPLRKGVKKAFHTLANAGILTYIATGDHHKTTSVISQDIGINADTIYDGSQNICKVKNIQDVMSQFYVFARITPYEKQCMVSALKKKGETVAVLGDGINDIPAFSESHVSISMGQTGTHIAKQVSDMVFTDDNFSRIVYAIEVGRKALDNFKKGLTFYLMSKYILFMLFVIPLIIVIPFPFLPIHIVIIELLMDLASSTIFVSEEAEPGIMDQRNAMTVTSFISWSICKPIILYGSPLALGICSLYMYTYYMYSASIAHTTAFVSWLIGHIILALNVKQMKAPLSTQGFVSNTFGVCWLIGMVVLSFVVTKFSWFHYYVDTTDVPLFVWMLISGMVIITTMWIDIYKRIIYTQKR
jgi:Ca2+-transporting ATPase